MLVNNGFPPSFSDFQSRGLFMAYHYVAAMAYKEAAKKAEGTISSFREGLLNEIAGDFGSYYQGIYADDQLLCPSLILAWRFS